MFNLLKSKKGFTLVELMVVVVILGILVAIAVPLYNNATDSAEETACEANIKIIESAIEMAVANGTTRAEVDNTDVAAEISGGMPTCPAGGAAYSVSGGTLAAHTH